MKKLTACILAAALLSFLGWRLLDGENLARRISAATARYGTALEFQALPAISLFPPAVTFGKIHWQGDFGGFAMQLSAAGGQALLQPLSLLFGAPAITELELNEPVLLVAANEQPARADTGPLPQISRFVVRNGRVELGTEKGSCRLEQLRLAASIPGPRQEAEIQGDFILNWQREGNAPLAGNLAFRGFGRYYAPNLTFREVSATFTSTDEGLLGRFSPFQAQFEGALDLKSRKGRIQRFDLSIPDLAASGSATWEAGEFPGEVSFIGSDGESEPFSLKSRFQLNSEKAVLENFSFNLWDSPGSGSLSLDFAPARISGRISLDLLRVDRIWPGADPDGLKIPFWPELDIACHLGAAEWQQLRLEDIDFQIGGAAGALELANFRGKWAEGSISGSASLGTEAFALNCEARNLNSGVAFEQLGLPGLTGGRASFSLDLKSQGPDYLAQLTGSGNLTCRDLRLDPFGELALLLPLLGKRGSRLPHSLEVLRARFRAGDGVAELAPVTATGPGFEGHARVALDLQRAFLSGALVLKAPGLDLPVVFEGPPDEISWRIEPELLKTGQ